METVTWTPERVDILKQLWKDGLTASQISKRLGGVTRNACIGKVRRLSLPFRGSGRPKYNPGASRSIATPRELKARRTQARARVSTVQELFKAEAYVSSSPELVIPINERKQLVDLTSSDCCSPIGDPKEKDFHFCGRPRVVGLPYCEHHARRNYQPAYSRINMHAFGTSPRPSYVDWMIGQLPVKDNSKEFAT